MISMNDHSLKSETPCTSGAPAPCVFDPATDESPSVFWKESRTWVRRRPICSNFRRPHPRLAPAGGPGHMPEVMAGLSPMSPDVHPHNIFAGIPFGICAGEYAAWSLHRRRGDTLVRSDQLNLVLLARKLPAHLSVTSGSVFGSALKRMSVAVSRSFSRQPRPAAAFGIWVRAVLMRL